jgi:hypothetical protein
VRGSRLVMLAAAVVLSLAASCTRQDIWHGVRFNDGGDMELASLMPQCGCVSVTNTSGGPVILRATLHGVKVGETMISEGETREYRFDWAGSDNRDRYVVTAHGQGGEGLKASKVIRLNSFATVVSCRDAACGYGDLQMSKAFFSEQDLDEDLSRRSVRPAASPRDASPQPSPPDQPPQR